MHNECFVIIPSYYISGIVFTCFKSIINRYRFFSHSIILAGMFVFVQHCYCQLPDYHVQQFDYSWGIRPGNIIALNKDSKGFLWILYDRSVQRFDGSRIVNFKPGNDLANIVCDNNGRLWLNSRKKVFYFNENRQVFEEVPVASKDDPNHLGSLFILPGKPVMVSSRNAIYVYNETVNRFIYADINKHISPPYYEFNFTSFRNSIFYQRGDYVYRYNTYSNRIDSIKNVNPQFIYPFSEDSAIVSAWNNTSYWNNFIKHTITPIKTPAVAEPDAFKYLNVRDVKQTAANRYLIASSSGLFQYNNLNDTFVPLNIYENGEQKHTADYTSGLYVDPDNFVWMITGSGISRFSLNGQSFGLLRINKQRLNLPATIDNIRGITGDGQYNFWLASANGFIHWNRKDNNWTAYLPQEGSHDQLSYSAVRGIAWDGQYVILGPGDLGIWLFNPVTKKYKRPQYESDSTKQLSEQDYIDAITTLQNGNHVITGKDAIYILDGKTYTLKRLKTPASRENANFCFQTPDGYVWLTTQLALHLFDSNMTYVGPVTLPGKQTRIRAGFATADNRFLFTLDNGLYIASRTGKKAEVTKYSEVFDNIFIASLYQDEKGTIWASSDNGIYSYDTLHKRLHLYDYTDNVQGYGFSPNCWYRSHDGTLFFGGTNGLNYLNPEKMRRQSDHLKVYIAYIRLFNDSVVYNISNVYNIPYNERSFEVGFAAPYYNNAGKVQYRYRLAGFDDVWTNLGNNNQLRFTGLGPGKYVLEVQASINNVDWISAPSAFPFIIKVPFWLSGWFLLCCLVCLSALIFISIKSRNRRLHLKQEELEVEQAVNHFASSMYQQQSIREVLWDVARNCIGRLHFEDCVIYELDKERQVLCQVAAYGAKSPKAFTIITPIEIPVGKGITGYVAQTGQPVIVKNTLEDKRYIVDDKRRLSEITVPIIIEDAVFGIIDCEHSKKSFFTQKHLHILQTIASLCAGKIMNIKAEAEKAAAEKSLMETKQKMAEVEMQALRAQMNPHFIFNCLNSINRYIVKSDQATASLYLTRFAKLIRLILDNSNNQTVTLSSELEALKLYIEMESIRFEKQFTYTITTDEDVCADSLFVPPLIIQPYVENSIWHGLLHKEEAGHLSVHLSISNNVLQCMIEDNGVGRQRAMELKSKSVSSKKSLGMKLTEDRLALLNMHVQFDASVEISDLKYNDGSAAGTRVIIMIPVDQ
ncbi:histidine kinase [Parafilimonas sp.]|uniref:histidine kinase n=1 Tax=Parafilimonas sp. TaxID=1969739 RepID=UPI003F7E83BD